MSTPAKIPPSKLCENIAHDIINLFLDETNVRLSSSHRGVLLGAIQSIISQQILKNQYSLLPDSQLEEITKSSENLGKQRDLFYKKYLETEHKLESLQKSFYIPKV